MFEPFDFGGWLAPFLDSTDLCSTSPGQNQSRQSGQNRNQPCPRQKTMKQATNSFHQYQKAQSRQEREMIALVLARILVLIMDEEDITLEQLLFELGELVLMVGKLNPIQATTFVWEVSEASRQIQSGR